MNKKMFDIMDVSGKEVAAEIISVFTMLDTKNQYLIYTLNESDETGLVKIYVSRLLYDNNAYHLLTITDDVEWNQVKDIMKNMVRGE